MKERQYPDSELANRTKHFLMARLHLSPKEVGQKGSEVYLRYYDEEFVGIYSNDGLRRYFSFHLENPRNNVKTALENQVMTDIAVVKRKDISKYKKIFSKVKIEKDSISYGEEKHIPTVALKTKILDVPLGKQGRLSGNFLTYNFHYNIIPFILTVKDHKEENLKNN
tara:strand:- start:861 stop:1361 length:501 start_codon:yes stop_codon:yes gene_type:complete